MNCVSSVQLPGVNGTIPYVQQVIGAASGITATTSTNKIYVLDYNNLNNGLEIGQHENQITNMESKDQNLIVTSGLDGAVKVWDVRTHSKVPSQEFRAPFPLLSFDVSCDGQYIIGGSEQVQDKKKNIYFFCEKPMDSEATVAIFFWDTRMPKFELTSFVESHSNDITQIKCHPYKPKQFLSASTDGLACLYNFEQTLDENDAMTYSCNVNISIQQAGYFGPSAEFLYCLSDMNTLSLWSDDSTEIVGFDSIITSDDELTTENTTDYVISCAFDTNTNNMYLNTGNNDGNIDLLKVELDQLNKILSLSSGHTDIVRSISWDFLNYKAITGGEDGKICLWSA